MSDNCQIITNFDLNKIVASRDKLTPMMQQFIDIKLQYSDALLFYRMGDFYELFFDDAVIAAKILGITLTKRGKIAEEDIPMCGVPIHSSDDYLHKLITAGQRVAICEQLEEPSEAKKNRGYKAVVKRGVTRLVTPGTLTEEKLLEPTSSNFLMTLGYVKEKEHIEFSLAWIDISTGSFNVKTTDKISILSDILRIQPKELLVADVLFHTEDPIITEIKHLQHIITQHPHHFFSHKRSEETIKNYYKLHSLDGIDDFSDSAKSAIASAILYVEKTQLQNLPSLNFPKLEKAQEILFIDAAARQSLELTQTMSGKKTGSLLKAIDRTITSAGARLLSDRLVAPLRNTHIINQRLESVNFFFQSADILQAVRKIIKNTPDILRALNRLFIDRGSPRDMHALLQIEEICINLQQLLNKYLLPQELSLMADSFCQIPNNLFYKLKNSLADELPALKKDGNFIRTGYNNSLDNTRILRDESRNIIAKLQQEYIQISNVKNLKIKFNNILGYFIETTTANASNLIANNDIFIHRQTTSNLMRFTTVELSELESKIANASNEALKIELEIFEELRKEIVANTNFFKQICEAISVFDVSASLALLALEQNYCYPIVNNSLNFNIEQGRHPVVEIALANKKSSPFIANDCCLSPSTSTESGKIWLLTGPNMGGKSTFLRQNALIALMAQIGSFVPAKAAEIGVIDRLFSRVGASDDLANNRSTFMVEMIETATILNQATEHSLVIFDEIGRGTATFDGLSIAWSVLEYLHDKNACRTIFATHFHEMTFLSCKLSRLENVTIKVKDWQGELIFLYEIIKGIADKSYGIQVAKLAGLPLSVIKRAKIILEKLDKKSKKNNLQDLPLFTISEPETNNNIIAPLAKIDYDKDPLYNKISSIDIDDLTPRSALEILYELKKSLPTKEYN
ncbi:DNA mismatch repair protein MutS [Bartonella sp. DGB1]|uniref:DNA mismatch repair protein MutS n=1 Tax=Bartonella sp. DGB1 TaxID=3239807 RepID=UPI003524F342